MYSARQLAAVLVLACAISTARAGLYYSGEDFAELPSQWRGFLLDQRLLRNIAVKSSAGRPASPTRTAYLGAARALETIAARRKLTADESADLGAIYVRLGEIEKAVQSLRIAEREYPRHFHIAANLGTAWQLHGDLEQAVICLRQAVRLAPGKMQKAEDCHLRLVQGRQRRPRDSQQLDDLFGVRYVGDQDKYEPGKLTASERKKLPSDAVATVQQLALWLPADGRLLWQLAELANAHGDVKTAAAIMEGCVTEFALNDPDLRRRRQILRAAAAELAQVDRSGLDASKSAHEAHAGLLRPRSKRPLKASLDHTALPPIEIHGVNALPWSVLAETILDRRFNPTFANYLKDLEGKQIILSGFMQPLTSDPEAGSFMLIEYPVGCWYCEMPEMAGIVLVELPADKTAHFTRGIVRVVGTLKLNSTDPENFLYIIQKAKVAEAD